MNPPAKKFPPHWDEARVKRLLDHYEQQSDEEAVAEDEAGFDNSTGTVMNIPSDLVSTVRDLLTKHRKSA